MRKVFLEGLPKKKGFGANKGKLVIDWKNSVGDSLEFIYDDVHGSFKILNHDSKQNKIDIEYKDKIYKFLTYHVINCEISKILMKRTSEFKYEIGQIIEKDNNCYVVKDREKRFLKREDDRCDEYRKWYKCLCDKCKCEQWILESNLLKYSTCPVCTNKKVEKGMNDIATTHPHLVKYFVNEVDTYKYSYGSTKKVLMKCPDCGNERNYSINKLNRGYLACKCSDNISYPNKFLDGLFNQIGLKYECEKLFRWSDNKRYDMYLQELTLIVENHGLQHYNGSFESYGGRTLEEEQENDKLKRDLALNNGIKHYIELDCRKSEMEWIKNSVMNSELPKLLGFKEEDIDWLECEKFARKNIVKEVCSLWDGRLMLKDFSTMFKYDCSTIRRWLRIGNSNGWCVYNEEQQRKRAGINTSLANKKRCCKEVLVFKDGQLIGNYESASELERISENILGVKLISTMICNVCNGKRKQYKGYYFKYA